MERVHVGEYVVIAAEILGIDPHVLAHSCDLGSADSALAAPFAGWEDTEIYLDLPTKAAVLCSRLVRNHPLIDGNKRAAYETMQELIYRGGGEWRPPEAQEAAEIVERLASREVSEEEFAGWVAPHVTGR